MTIQIIIADDHAIVRAGLTALLNSEPGLSVIGEAANGREALRMVEQLKPDVVLMDISMSEMSGLEATRAIKANHPQTRILILTVHEDREMLKEAIRSGASGYLPKHALKSELVNSIHAAVRNEFYVHSMMTHLLINGASPVEESKNSEYEPLTKREIQVLQLLAKGYTNSNVAEQLDISERTVEFHRKNIMFKLNLNSRAELVQYATDKGLV